MNRLENNERSADVETIEKICSTLNITLLEFFYEGSEPIVFTDDLKELINNAKALTPEQLKQLTLFLKTLK